MLKKFGVIFATGLVLSACSLGVDPDAAVATIEITREIEVTPVVTVVDPAPTADEVCGEGWEFEESRIISVELSDDGEKLGHTAERCTVDGMITIEAGR